MTRKHFVMLAAALKDARSNYTHIDAAQVYNNGIDNAAHRIADALAQDNPRFDRARFLKACGVSE